MTLVSHRDLQSSVCVRIEYRLDGGIFNLRRIQAKTKTSSAVINAFQFDDNVAFQCLTADGFQRSLDVMSETYLYAGHMVNTAKTDVRHHLMLQHFSLVGKSLITPKILFTCAQISHFLVTSQIRPKDALTSLHQPLAI